MLDITWVVSDIFEKNFINAGNTDKNITESCPECANNQFSLNSREKKRLSMKCEKIKVIEQKKT